MTPPRPWIKLWTEILDDPKVGMLDVRLRWRFVECLLLAGHENAGGRLPTIEKMAYRLRVIADVLEADLNDLMAGGLLDYADGWIVKHWSERQAPMTATDRSRWHRQQEKHGNATILQRSSNENATRKRRGEEEQEEEEEGEAEETRRVAFSRLVRSWESAVGPITQMIGEDLADLAVEAEHHRRRLPEGAAGADKDGTAWVDAAIREAAASTGTRPNTKFVGAILRRWLVEGFESKRLARPASASLSKQGRSAEAIDRVFGTKGQADGK